MLVYLFIYLLHGTTKFNVPCGSSHVPETYLVFHDALYYNFILLRTYHHQQYIY